MKWSVHVYLDVGDTIKTGWVSTKLLRPPNAKAPCEASPGLQVEPLPHSHKPSALGAGAVLGQCDGAADALCVAAPQVYWPACLGSPKVLLASSGESPQEARAPDIEGPRPFLGQECVGVGNPEPTSMRLQVPWVDVGTEAGTSKPGTAVGAASGHPAVLSGP